MRDTWFMDLEPITFTIAKTRLLNNSTISSKYSGIFCTTGEKVDVENPTFPTWYYHELPSMETGMDLENTTVNAVEHNVQIDVTDVTSKERVREIIGITVTVMKSMGYTVYAMPEVFMYNNAHVGVIRCRRTIGYGDNDIVQITE